MTNNELFVIWLEYLKNNSSIFTQKKLAKDMGIKPQGAVEINIKKTAD